MRISKALNIVFLGLLMLATACSHGDEGANRLGPDWQYRLDTGDTVKVTVFGEENLSNSYAVDTGGAISMPLVGKIHARGYTTDQLSQAIGDALANGYLRNPSIAVEVAEYRPFFILGEVNAPGKYAYVPGLSVQAAVAMGGGYTYRAKTSSVTLTRKNAKGESVKLSADATAMVLPGDVITVGERLF